MIYVTVTTDTHFREYWVTVDALKEIFMEEVLPEIHFCSTSFDAKEIVNG